MAKDYLTFSDEELITMLRSGEDAAMDYLINKYKPVVKQISRALYLEGGDQEDLLQEGMIGLYKAIKEYDEARNEASFSTFAYSCIKNQMYKAVAAASRQKNSILNNSLSLADIDQSQELPATTLPSPEKIVIEREAEELLRTKIRKILSQMENEVLELYLSGLNYKEIAEKLGKSEKSIDNALSRIRAKARANL